MMFEHVLFLSVYLFSIGIYGLITSRNMVRALICLELILNSINLNLVTFSDLFDSRQLKGDIFAIFVIALAAAEAAIGLSILSSIHRNRKSTRINQIEPCCGLFQALNKRGHLKNPLDRRIRISYNPHNLRFSARKQFAWLYIHPKVSFLIHLLGKLVHIECILYMYHKFLQNVTLDL